MFSGDPIGGECVSSRSVCVCVGTLVCTVCIVQASETDALECNAIENGQTTDD